MIKNFFFLLLFVLASAGLAHSESVFLKNGKIVTGEIKEVPGENSIIVDGEKIERDQIIRINITEDHKAKRYFYLRDGSLIEGYVVKESFDRYIYRLKLESPDEQTILKSKLYFVTLKKIYLAKGKKMPQVDPPRASGEKQAVFLKDGTIIEGKILSETKEKVVIRDTNGEKKTFARDKVKRTIYNDSYKHPFYLYKFNNFYDRAFVVGENSSHYFLKDELTDKSEDEEKKSKYNFVSYSKIPLDTTKYEYPDLSFMLMYVPSPDGGNGGWNHTIVLGLDWTDPIRPSLLPYWMHWTAGFIGIINVNNQGVDGGTALKTGFTFDIWRFVYARLEAGNMYSFNSGGTEIGIFGLAGAGVRFTFEDFFFLGLEAGAIFARTVYESNAGDNSSTNIMPSVYITFGFNFY